MIKKMLKKKKYFLNFIVRTTVRLKIKEVFSGLIVLSLSTTKNPNLSNCNMNYKYIIYMHLQIHMNTYGVFQMTIIIKIDNYM
jgi:metal-responsive CopG/Arc/MetJ family transcriptional regulator